MSIRVVTDSSCDLPERVVKELNISVLPLYIHTGSHEYLDGIDLTREQFYRDLPGYPEHPTTAVPSPQKFKAIYDALAEEGAEDVVSIHISHSLSGIVDVAHVAALETTSTRVTVLDSHQLSLGTGFLAETAARLANAGAALHDIMAALQDQVKRTHTIASLNTLEFLRRSGRMSAAMSTIGELLQIKPLLKMHDGKPEAERIRTRKKALQRLVDLIRTHAPYEKAAFLHSLAEEEARSVIEAVKNLLPGGDVWLEQVTPVLGAHIGPGVVGFSGISKA